jgi:hypothetical protein
MQYRYKGESEVLVPELHLLVKPGDVVEAELINNESFEPIDGKKDKPAAPAATEEAAS